MIKSLAIGLLLGVIGGLVGGATVFARIYLDEQTLNIVIHDALSGKMDVRRPLKARAKGVLSMEIPFRETLKAPMRQTYTPHVNLDLAVPVKMVIEQDLILKVDTLAQIETKSHFLYAGVKSYRNTRIKAKMPLKMDVPVKLKTPVETVVKMKYSGPLSTRINQDLRAPVDTIIRIDVPIDHEFVAPVQSRVAVDMTPQPVPVAITVRDTQLTWPLLDTRLTSGD